MDLINRFVQSYKSEPVSDSVSESLSESVTKIVSESVSDESVDDRSVFDIFGDDVEEPESTEAKIETRPKTTTQTTVSSTRKMSTSSIQEVTSEESNESTNQNPASSEYDDRSSCINLHPPKNGFLQYSAGLSQGSIVTYSCISGFDIRQRGPIRKVILTISPAK